MTEETRLFQQVDDELSSLLATTSPAYRRRLTYRLAKAIRGDQQRRIRSQKNSDGTAYQPRKNRVLRSKKQIKFLKNKQNKGYLGYLRSINTLFGCLASSSFC
mgnify:CR=1 FL=1